MKSCCMNLSGVNPSDGVNPSGINPSGVNPCSINPNGMKLILML